jgi:hypothetical protein
MEPTPLAVVAKQPAEFSSSEVDDFVAFVLAGGEVAPTGLRARVLEAHSIAFLRSFGCLLGVAGLKRPAATYRARIEKGATFVLPLDAFPLELGWVFVLPSARGGKSFPLCQPLIAGAKGVGIFSTSRASNPGMHVTLGRLSFARVGSEWRSKQNDDNLRLFVKNAV